MINTEGDLREKSLSQRYRWGDSRVQVEYRYHFFLEEGVRLPKGNFKGEERRAGEWGVATLESLGEDKESEKEAVEKLGIWVSPNSRPPLALIKAMSPGRLVPWWLVRHMDPGLYLLPTGV